MTPFEEDLRKALARCEPSKEFTAAVLRKVAERQHRTRAGGVWNWFREVPVWRFAPVALALLIMSGGMIYEQHQRDLRGETAKRQLLTAMRIAGAKLYQTQQHINQAEDLERQQ